MKTLIAVVLALIAIALFSAGFVLLASASAPCQETLASDPFLKRYVSCRSLNEIGDTLAGVFAPIAAVLVALAVYLQSQELKAQREEMIDTMAVYEEQRDLTQRQAAAMELQVKMLVEQESDRLRSLKLINFENALATIHTIIRARLSPPVIPLMEDQTQVPVSLLSQVKLPDQVDAALGMCITSALTQRANNNAPRHFVEGTEHWQAGRAAQENIVLALRLGGEIGEMAIARVKALRLLQFYDLLREFLGGAYLHVEISDELRARYE